MFRVLHLNFTLFVYPLYTAFMSSKLGVFGEDIACQFLLEKRYRILSRNFRRPWGEIDIIARHPSGILIFVEVKTIRQGSLLPEDHLTVAKLGRLSRTSELLANGEYEKESKKGWQIDLVAIALGDDNVVTRITHYENIAGLT